MADFTYAISPRSSYPQSIQEINRQYCCDFLLLCLLLSLFLGYGPRHSFTFLMVVPLIHATVIHFIVYFIFFTSFRHSYLQFVQMMIAPTTIKINSSLNKSRLSMSDLFIFFTFMLFLARKFILSSLEYSCRRCNFFTYPLEDFLLFLRH